MNAESWSTIIDGWVDILRPDVVKFLSLPIRLGAWGSGMNYQEAGKRLLGQVTVEDDRQYRIKHAIAVTNTFINMCGDFEFKFTDDGDIFYKAKDVKISEACDG